MFASDCRVKYLYVQLQLTHRVLADQVRHIVRRAHTGPSTLGPNKAIGRPVDGGAKEKKERASLRPGSLARASSRLVTQSLRTMANQSRQSKTKRLAASRDAVGWTMNTHAQARRFIAWHIFVIANVACALAAQYEAVDA